MLTLRLADGRELADRVTVGASLWARFRGLMLRPPLARGEGLYLPGTASIHMLFMRFPIDCLFIGRPTENGSRPVLATRHALPPWRGVVWLVRGAKGVVELPAGTLQQVGVSAGDLVTMEPPSPVPDKPA